MGWLEATLSVSGPSGQPVYRKNAEILVEIWNRFFLTLWWKVIFNTWCPTTQKRQKFVAEKYHKPYSSPEPQWRSIVDTRWLCFSPSQTCVKCFTSRLICADTTKCVHFLIRKGVFDWKHALERLRSNGHSICLQRLVSVVKFIAERRLAFRDDENVGSPRKFFQKIFKTYFKQILKRRCDASDDRFCNSFTNR